MNRYLTWIIGPEVIMAIVTAAVGWLCARHPSREGRDIQMLEKAVTALPFLVVPLVFASMFVPGGRNWLWLCRAVVVTYVLLAVCSWKLIEGFGSGAKGQDAAFIMAFYLATFLIAIGSAVNGAYVLADVRPGFAQWFRTHKFLGGVLTLLSAVPIGFGFGVILAFGLGFFGALVTSIKR